MNHPLIQNTMEINSSGEKGVVNMEIEGSDPMVMPAPDIAWRNY